MIDEKFIDRGILAGFLRGIIFDTMIKYLKKRYKLSEVSLEIRNVLMDIISNLDIENFVELNDLELMLSLLEKVRKYDEKSWKLFIEAAKQIIAKNADAITRFIARNLKKRGPLDNYFENE
ncbi:MAG: hypothetical protein ACP6IQ_07465 [Candidatus Njordarchaeia archaeon]